MTLEVKSGAADTFARRPIQGAKAVAANAAPDQLLLDGQQRMTSLYQTCLRREVVQTVTPRLKLVKRWFYIDIQKAMNPAEDRENAIVSVPEDRRIKSNFDRKIDLDLSMPELEYQNLMFPLNQVFDWDEWQDGFNEYWLENDTETRKLFKPFKDEVLQNFKAYQLPVITLGPDTAHEAVCLVFEKVNTGGKPLDAFELVTAMYAARGHRLRDDWLWSRGPARAADPYAALRPSSRTEVRRPGKSRRDGCLTGHRASARRRKTRGGDCRGVSGVGAFRRPGHTPVAPGPAARGLSEAPRRGRGVNRHSILTPNRRAKLTPLSDTAEVVPVANRGDPRGFV